MQTLFWSIGALLLAGFSARAEEMPDECLSGLRAFAQEEALRVACDIADITKKIIEGKEEGAPSTLYHFGKKELMLANAAEGNIPQKAWDDYIMGEKDRRFALAPIRRGLYGTHFIDTNFFYSKDTYNWMMEVRLKPECRHPSRVASLQNLYEDSRFHAWIKQRAGLPLSAEEFKVKCRTSMDYRQLYAEPTCAEVANLFLQENKIGVVQDHIVKKSFYVRDRDCIEGIRAKAPDLIEIFANNPGLWVNSCMPTWGQESNFSAWQVLYRVLVEEDLSKVPEETLDRLAANTKLLDPSAGDTRSAINTIVNSFRNARKEGKASEWQAAMREIPKYSVNDTPLPPVIGTIPVSKVLIRLNSF